MRQQHLSGPALYGTPDAGPERYFHYRNPDVSTIKELVKRRYPDKAFIKESTHVALADIHDSIDELRHYRAQVFLPPAGQSQSGTHPRILKSCCAGSLFFMPCLPAYPDNVAVNR